ncbi:MAG TPA: hypothetical protein VKN18_27270 [Blastocatellia bacterium]|nr:hypothetical protein [Blastocatellia bacterium]
MTALNHYRSVPILVLLFSTFAAGQDSAKVSAQHPTKGASVVFVCEHGSAKSVIAAAYFNKLAKEKNLKMQAVSRGTNPDSEIAPRVAAGLRADGLTVAGEKPKRLSQADVSSGTRLVAFCELPEAYKKSGRVEQWNDVPAVSEDYNKARDVIVEHIKRLLDELKSEK